MLATALRAFHCVLIFSISLALRLHNIIIAHHFRRANHRRFYRESRLPFVVLREQQPVLVEKKGTVGKRLLRRVC